MKTISKLEAARRQLNCAIRLYLNEDDLASVQTLAWAGLTILRDLTAAAGLPTRSGSWSSIYDLDRRAANLLKHANRDPCDWLLEIDPTIPEFVFHEAIALYSELGGEITKEMSAARTVVDIKYGFYLPFEERSERRREEERKREYRLEDLDEEEREEELAELERDRRSWQSALMNLGRARLSGQPLFEDPDRCS
jgi:hypothetical protein